MKKINKKFFLSMLGGIVVCGLAAGVATSCKNNNELIEAVNEYNNYVAQVKATDFYKNNVSKAQEIDKLFKETKQEIDKHKKDADFITILKTELTNLKSKIDPMVKKFNGFVELNKKVTVSYKNAKNTLFAEAKLTAENFELAHPEAKVAFVKAEKGDNTIVVSYTIENKEKEKSEVFTKEISSSEFKVDFATVDKGTSVTYKNASEVTFANASLGQSNYELSVTDKTFNITFVSAKKDEAKTKISVVYKLSKNKQEQEFTKEILADNFKKEEPKQESIDFATAFNGVSVTYKKASEVTFADALLEENNYELSSTDQSFSINFKKAEKDTTNSKIIVSFTLTKNEQESTIYTKEILANSFKQQ
ncbi:hypothetical protein OF375_01765 [Ureaplasma miroungigenitalium]|uniref:Vmc-like lipoprotein signal peptide domain-containing protein n=1 Tax=Ureaplasma miroungigenitalium TaxID=1042321 RepID=UPI0021E79D93|nr:hypothetical protein [Ureaplasma miroungigenitalium]MCV3734294.1 hypothetical protein [Ureaplasma miroungigenitalium]